MAKSLMYVLALAGIVAVGVVDRVIRWQRRDSPAVHSAVERLEALPMRIGDWEGQDVPVDDISVRVAGCAAFKNIRYMHTVTGRTADLTVMVGQAGQMAEHVPEACYPASGHTQVRNSLRRHAVAQFLGPEAAGELVSVDFVHPQVEQTLRVWHGWFDGLQWSRPEYPRIVFVQRPFLYRMQVAAFLLPDPLSADQMRLIDSGEEFLHDALPLLTRLLSGEPLAPADRPNQPAGPGTAKTAKS